jgi:hypothetical protein
LEGYAFHWVKESVGRWTCIRQSDPQREFVARFGGAAETIVRGASSKHYYYPTLNIKNGVRILKKVSGSRIGLKDIKRRDKYKGQGDKKYPTQS